MAWKILFIYYLGLSLITGGMHCWDKIQAVRGGWRVQERSLHSFEALGGWPGAILVTRAINHKVQKQKYMWVLYGISIAHFLGWIFFMWLATR